MDDQLAIRVIEELTPRLSLNDHVTCHARGTEIFVDWFGERFSFNTTDLASVKHSDGQVVAAIIAYLRDVAPVTQEELQVHGVPVYTASGRMCYVQRWGAFYQVPATVNWSLTPLPEPRIDDFQMTIEGGLVCVSSKNTLPHALTAHGKDFFMEVVDQMVTVTDDMRIGLSDDPYQQVVLGHRHLMDRFAQEMARPIRVIPVIKLDAIR